MSLKKDQANTANSLHGSINNCSIVINSDKTGLFSALNRQQKEAIGLLQIGTLLEYFDLFLYIHMAVILNELFFPKTSQNSSSLLATFTFCSTYILRPLGALLFGYIGDTFGRKTTVIITSMMMAFACAVMAILPTYAEIGITASCIAIGCRVLQGLASMGEINSAEIYLSEITKPPTRYFVVSLVDTASAVGGLIALLVANLAVSLGFNWRIAFIIGAGIAIIGVAARTRLRETRDFSDMKRRMQQKIEALEKDWVDNVISTMGFAFRKNIRRTAEFAEVKKRIEKIVKEGEKAKVCPKTTLAAFLLYAGWPVFFYFSYVYCGNILKDQFYYTSAQVIKQNFVVSIFDVTGMIILSILSYKIHPLRLVKIRLILFIPVILLIPYLLYNISSPVALLALQVFCVCLAPIDFPAASVVVLHFPVFKRFTWVSMLHALSRILLYLVTSFGLVYAIKYFHYWGLLLIMLPVVVGFAWGLEHFIKLEAEAEREMQTENVREIMR